MNQYKHDETDQLGPIVTLVAFLKARPEKGKVTIVDRAVLILSHASMLLILLGVVITFFEVVARYVFNSPTSWVYGKTLWLGAVIYLVSGAYAMQRRSHISITTIYNTVPAWLRMSFDYLALFVIVVYSTLMVVGGSELAIAAFLEWIRHGRVLDLPIPGTIKPLVLIMTVVVAVVAINNLLKDHCGFGKAFTNSRADRDMP
jgi:TRAP-type C4-dicarboxylate transport system permease small subunit